MSARTQTCKGLFKEHRFTMGHYVGSNALSDHRDFSELCLLDLSLLCCDKCSLCPSSAVTFVMIRSSFLSMVQSILVVGRHFQFVCAMLKLSPSVI